MAGYGRIFCSASPHYRNLFATRTVVLNTQPNASLNAKVLSQLGVPPRPKKPMTPFFKFLQNERYKVRADNPNMGYQDSIRKVGEMWATHDPNAKSELMKEYDRELITYSKKIMIYEQSLTPEHRKLIKDEKMRLQNKAHKKQLKKKVEALGKPRKPPSAFIQFLNKKLNDRNKDVPMTEWVKTVASEWTVMQHAEKLHYFREVDHLMEQYKIAMKDWEEKMVRMGNIDVVRIRGLMDIKENNAPEAK